MKHLLIRPRSEIQIDGVLRTSDDQIAHIITDIDLHTLASMISYGRVIVEIRDDEDAVSDEAIERTSGELGSDAVVKPDSAPDPLPEVQQQSEGDKHLDLVAYYIESGISETVAEALADAVYGADEIQDRELLKTVAGIRQWVATHKDLTTLPKIGKTRAADILKVIG